MAGALLIAMAAAGALPVPADADTRHANMVLVPAGEYVPFFKPSDPRRPTIRVESFWIDARPVTNRQYLGFVATSPAWRRSQVKAIFADSHYLADWPSDVTLSKIGNDTSPVTGVSWFAARAYCRAQGKSLPTTDQWEYALHDRGRNADAVRERTLAWYASENSPATNRPVPANGFGIHDLTGRIWEWTDDFDAFLSGSDLRGKSDDDKTLFCGGGSVNASDATDYATFMRYSLRASLKASYATKDLGFRCVSAP